MKGTSRSEAREGSQSALMVKSVEKAFLVLNAFDGDTPNLSLAEIARILETDKSTAQRFTYTLEKLGYLEKDKVQKTFSLTAKNLNSAYSFMKGSKIVSAAMPYLQHIHHETSETVNLSVLDGTDIRFIMRLPGSHILSADVMIGRRIPAYCTASGTTILAFLEESAARAILEKSNIKQYTKETTTDIDAIMAQRDVIRRRGYALNLSGYFHDDISAAVPVLGRNGHPVAAISIGVSSTRFSIEAAEKAFVPYLQAATRAISIG